MEDEDLFDIEELRSLPKKSLKPTIITVSVLAIVLAVWGIFVRNRDAREVREWTETQAIPTVKVLHPYRNLNGASLTLPGNIQAFYEAPILARVNGYLKNWYHDFGDRVKKGEVLAEIDTPDLDEQYNQAKAKLAKVQADEKLAEITAERWQRLVVTDAVSKQERDQKVADLEAQKAAVRAAEADMNNVGAFESFKKLVAPFDGVVTARKTDIGALIDAGKGQELFAVSQMNPLRVFVPVPQFYAPNVRKGDKALILVPEHPGEQFAGAVSQLAQYVTQATGTMLVEIVVNNADGKLLPGDYAEVSFSLTGDKGKYLRIPSSSLILRTDGVRVAVVKDNQLKLVKINVGSDYGKEVEILSGLTEQDWVVDSPSDYVFDGEKVEVKKPVTAVMGSKNK